MPVVSIKGVNLDRWYADMSRFVTDLSYEMMQDSAREIIKIIESHEKDLFRSGGGAGKHGKWPSLNPKYAAWKSKRYPGKPIMVLTDRTILSLIGKSGDAISSVFKSGDRWYITRGTDVPYAKYHQKGKGRLPTRRVIDPDDKTAKQIVLAIQKRVVSSARRSKSWDHVDFRGMAEMDKHFRSI